MKKKELESLTRTVNLKIQCSHTVYIAYGPVVLFRCFF